MLSPDEKTLYVSEYKEQKLHAYEVDPKNGNASKRRLFAHVKPPSDYGCDGMTVDHLGNLYCAGPHAVRVWSPKANNSDNYSPGKSDQLRPPGRGNVLYITGRKNVFGSSDRCPLNSQKPFSTLSVWKFEETDPIG